MKISTTPLRAVTGVAVVLTAVVACTHHRPHASTTTSAPITTTSSTTTSSTTPPTSAPQQERTTGTATTQSCFNGPATIEVTVPTHVRAGQEFWVQVQPWHQSQVGPGSFGGEDIKLAVPALIHQVNDPGETVLHPSGATVAVSADARPGDVIEWKTPTYEFDFVARIPSPTGTISDPRHIVCLPVDPDQVIVRQTVID